MDEKLLTPQEYFNIVKERKHKVTEEDLVRIYDNCLELIQKYIKTGQVKAAKKLMFHLDCLEKEKDIIKAEAYKEFADRLKELDGYYNHNFDDCVNLLVSDQYIRGRYEKINEIWSTIDIILKEKEDNNSD